MVVVAEQVQAPSTYREAYVALDMTPCSLPHNGVSGGAGCNNIDLSRRAMQLAKETGITFAEAIAIKGQEYLSQLCSGCIIRGWIAQVPQERIDEINQQEKN